MRTTSVSQYLLSRLHELGLKHLFGVPGDYNLSFLDQVSADTNIKWVGNCNELNAAYTADGYARVSGISAVLTTFSVGEMSAINGIAGAYAENIPVIMIVGAPSLAIQAAKMPVHHTYADGDFSPSSKMYAHATVAQAHLTPENAATEIDRVLRECHLQKRPVYISLPTDVVNATIPAATNPLDLTKPASNNDTLAKIAEEITSKITNSTKTAAVIDILAKRFDMIEDIEKLLNLTKIPFATSCGAKSALSEENPQYLGIYGGILSSDGVKKYIEDSDCIIYFGRKDTDFNTGGFTNQLNQENIIEIYHNSVRLAQVLYEDIDGHSLLIKLLDTLKNIKLKIAPYHAASQNNARAFKPETVALTQDRLWAAMADFFKSEHHIIVETGTAMFGSLQLPLPTGSSYVSQMLWASIGYAFASALGAALALPSTKRAVILTGDGSFQLTAQELSNLARDKTNVIIILINNDGYTVERAIDGAEQKYNDIPKWDYLNFAKSLATTLYTAKAKTEIELYDALAQCNQQSDKLCFIEVITKKMDMPTILKDLMNTLYPTKK